jgi:hypothetical protein
MTTNLNRVALLALGSGVLSFLLSFAYVFGTAGIR